MAVLFLGANQRALAQGPFKNGFDLANAIVPAEEILRGGPPRDGIPAIDNPKFISPESADYLTDEDPVISFLCDGIARAYPLRILVWHEVVNDGINGKSFVISHCPLCGTSMVFNAMIDGERFTFGVSGLLYQSDVLFYDRQTESLWSQLALKAVSGSKVNSRLEWLPSEIMTFGAWKAKHQKLIREVLSTDITPSRPYSRNPYEGYEDQERLWFGVPANRDEFDNKVWILGILLEGKAKAYLISSLGIRGTITDEFAGKRLQISYDAETQEPAVVDLTSGERLAFTRAFWFAWQAFYPETEIWRPTIAQVKPDQLHLTVMAERDQDYILQTSPNLRAWRGLRSFFNDDGFFDFIFRINPGEDQRFYRVIPSDQ